MRLIPTLWQTAGLALLPLAAHAAAVDVRIRLSAPDALEISYTLPPQCRELPFLKNGRDGQWRASWQALDDCGAASGDTLSRSGDACPALRFRVPASAAFTGYPGALPIDGGIYVHTSNYALGDGCGEVAYRFLAPGIASAGRAHQGAAAAEAGGDTAALLLRVPLAPGSGPLRHFDARLSAETVAQIRTVADGTVSFLRAAMPDAVYRPPILAATWASEPGGPRVGGSASDVLLLTLYNWPDQPGPDERRQLTLLTAHEFSHRFQMRDAVDGYPDSRLIHEGGGEFLRWISSLQQGWLTPEQAAGDLDNALAQCMLYTEGKSWRALSPRAIGANRLEYHCGLPAYVYALAARQGKGSALARVNDFYKALRQGKTPDFGHALECAGAPQCQARWLPQLLGADAPMDAQWRALLRTSGLATARPATGEQRDAMMLKALGKLMAEDCAGRSSMTPMRDGVLLDGMSVCKTMRSDADVRRIETLPVFGDAQALPAMAAACAARHEVRLGMKNGDTLAVPCSTPYLANREFYGVDMEKVLARLLNE
ncbi:hypothetical protein [Janthinobacterium fluminis]|uniref:Peptidase M61 catalytic domain-containing protein n=1 Tax=Janthinobacterium fluminis TaxID=2987524 RepID=A0ABT5K660_9BURK|nr:hypothetical protein [Janthinobacterium fluminis]MDC8759883.1 hypothetical protein [Janthinobacterium fluminis]